MRGFITVMAFTLKENARKKVFIIATLITIFLVVLSIGIPAVSIHRARGDTGLTDISVGLKELQGNNINDYIVSIIIVTLIFLAIYFYSYGVSISIASEKTLRVMEILLTSTKPSAIILGKSVAMGLLGLGQFLSVTLAGFLTYITVFPKDYIIGKEFLDLSGLNPFTIIMLFLYFLLGYSVYAMINAVAGATVSKAEDISAALIPLSIITLIAYYVSIGVLAQPNGVYAKVISIIPFSSPLAMPCRLMMSEVASVEIIVSILLLVLSICVLSCLSVKIYSNAVLHYGKRMNIREMVKLFR